jgi:polyferredoxin
MSAVSSHASRGSSARGGCGPGELSIHLPVVKPVIRKSRNAKRRALVLILVQLLIFAHIGLWLLSREFGWFGGKTLTPVEPSESMQTIETGALNAGAIFFAIALLSTLIFGRFFCGWACHIVMLQDFCAWIMKKCGVRPKPFRSRILVWAPLVIALYMFVWPTFKRLALFPILENAGAESLATFFIPVAGFRPQLHMTTDEFWATFSVIMAVPTLLIVGFAAVYFLGSKGFCTYGCPYGGFFAPLDEFAPGRIRVDPDKCEGCGHCTATCTSNVRVHEEVREFGMVVDPGCMKCMDCVSVCPNEALSFGFGKPATKKGKAKTGRILKQYDLSWREDIAIAVLFVLILVSARGLYLWEGVPFLMAVGIAGVLSFLLFKSWRLLMKHHEIVRIQNLNLKWRGRITGWGWLFLAITVVGSLLVAQNGVANALRWRADLIERRDAAVPREVALSPLNREAIPADIRAAAKRALECRKKAVGIADGGIALMTDPRELSRVAWLHVVAGEYSKAEAMQREVINRIGESDGACADLALIILFLEEDVQKAHEYVTDVLARHPEFQQVRAIAEMLEQ